MAILVIATNGTEAKKIGMILAISVFPTSEDPNNVPIYPLLRYMMIHPVKASITAKVKGASPTLKIDLHREPNSPALIQICNLPDHKTIPIKKSRMMFVMKPPSIAVIAKLELPKFRIKGISPVPPSCNTVSNAMIRIYYVAYAISVNNSI